MATVRPLRPSGQRLVDSYRRAEALGAHAGIVLGKLGRLFGGWRGTLLIDKVYHQGDVGEASYAAVPHLVRIHDCEAFPIRPFYPLVAIMEESRQFEKTPDLPRLSFATL